MAEIILRMYEMETGRGATGSKRRKNPRPRSSGRLRRSEESKRLEAEKLARVAVAKAQKAREEQRFWRWARQEAAGGKVAAGRWGRVAIYNGTPDNFREGNCKNVG